MQRKSFLVEEAHTNMIKKLPYKEGDWFALPLPEEGYAVGRIARMNENGRLLLGYFFGPRVTKIPELDELKNYKPEDAILVCRFGFLGLKNKEWIVIGSAEPWEREKWPMPVFQMKDFLVDNQYWRILYSSDDPSQEIKREVVPLEMVKGLPQDGLAGHGFVKEVLNKLLN